MNWIRPPKSEPRVKSRSNPPNKMFDPWKAIRYSSSKSLLVGVIGTNVGWAPSAATRPTFDTPSLRSVSSIVYRPSGNSMSVPSCKLLRSVESIAFPPELSSPRSLTASRTRSNCIPCRSTVADPNPEDARIVPAAAAPSFTYSRLFSNPSAASALLFSPPDSSVWLYLSLSSSSLTSLRAMQSLVIQ